MSDFSALTVGYHLQVNGGGATVPQPWAVRYSAELTGSADSTTDYALPVYGLALLLHSSRDSTATVYLPWASEIISAIDARPNGDLVIRKAWIYEGGTAGPDADVATFDLNDLNYSRGAENSSITLTGSTTFTNAAAKTNTIADVFFERKNSGGGREWSIPLSYMVYPDDSVLIDTETVSIESVSINANETQATQIITEPDPT